MRTILASTLAAALVAGCGDAHETLSPTPAERLRTLPTTEQWAMPALQGPAHIVRTEGDVPHIYASSRRDAAFLAGFTVARDRFFMIDLARRLGLGTISELLGDYALENDLQSRHAGSAYVADQILAGLTPEMAEHVDAFAAGINEYIARAKAGELQLPTELTLAAGFLNASDPAQLMKPFDRRDVAGMMAMVLYQTSYETGDVGRAGEAAKLEGLFSGQVNEGLRRAGVVNDIYHDLKPMFPEAISAAGFGLEAGAHAPPTARSNHPLARPAFAPQSLTSRLASHLDTLQDRLRRKKEAGFGSNAWAVAGYASKDGSGILAGDGHLDLSVPSVLYQIGIDTQLLGGGDLHQLGLVIPGMPLMPIGTNGRVAWSQTQLMEDVTDWYAEQVQLDDAGAPSAILFQGQWQALTRVDEQYVIADIPAFESKGRTEVWPRYVTEDGRFLADFEGREVSATDPVGVGETRVSTASGFVVPGDTDGDGIVYAISFDYGGFDAGSVLSTQDALGRASDVVEFREATRGLVAYSQNFAVADANGDILYTSYQAIPCRGYLQRNADGTWADGSDPSLLLDGTRYGGFRIPTRDGKVDESQGEDPALCVIPFERIPQSLDPDKGYVYTANNDPGGMSLDDSLTNDEYYVGGPWDPGTRADTIRRELQKAVDEGAADVAKMAEIQGNTDSRLGELFAPELIGSIARMQELSQSGSASGADARAVALYASEPNAIDEVRTRLEGWRDRGFKARSGVETYYAHPDGSAKQDAVATMLFNAWLGPCISMTFDDEGIPGVWSSGGRVKLFRRMLLGRGAGNPQGLASWSEATGESVFFDDVTTPEAESSDEIMMKALVKALTFLRSAPVDNEGGFDTTDMSQWIWGMRHQVRFESLLSGYLGSDPQFAFLSSKLEISTKTIPLEDDLAPGDPRSKLKWFPRDGDQWSVDAANPGFSGERFTYGSGPVMRMVVSMKGGTVTGRNIIPGGQSGIPFLDSGDDNPHFSDQARLWLANETYPLRFSVQDVVDGATGHEVYGP